MGATPFDNGLNYDNLKFKLSDVPIIFNFESKNIVLPLKKLFVVGFVSRSIAHNIGYRFKCGTTDQRLLIEQSMPRQSCVDSRPIYES